MGTVARPLGAWALEALLDEMRGGAVVAAMNLQQASAPHLANLLRPIQATGLPVLGIISDAQESIRLAVASIFPAVPHQWCQYHGLRAAVEPLWEADRHLLVQAKKELRGLRDVEERTRSALAAPGRGAAAGAPPNHVAPPASTPPDSASAPPPPPALPTQPPFPKDDPDPASAVVLDTVLALRQLGREHGLLPFDFAGLRVLDSLTAVEHTLARCLAKKGMPA